VEEIKMGGGSAIRRVKRNFLQGKPVSTGKKEVCAKTQGTVIVFGEYGVHKSGKGEYELLRKGVTIGIFSEAQIKEDEVLFALSHGVILEVSKGGIKEIITPEKATLLGLIAADGSNMFRREQRLRGSYRTEYSTRFYSDDKELANLFSMLSEEIYGITPHHYNRKKDNLITSVIYNKGIFYDLTDLNIKGGPYEFHVPRDHLNNDGKKAFVKGFFSGDGNVSIAGDKITIRFYSSYKEGLEELRLVLIDLGFHPHEILEYVQPTGIVYCFSVPREEHVKFINEIGSYKPRHVRIFEEYLRKSGYEVEKRDDGS
jgi:hypothetical protein